MKAADLWSRLGSLIRLAKGAKEAGGPYPPRMFCVICSSRNEWVPGSKRIYRCTGPVTHTFDLDTPPLKLEPKEKSTGEI